MTLTKTLKRGLGRLACAGAAILALGAPAHAWKVPTHVYLTDRALDDARDGTITIHRIDPATGERIGRPGEYKVDPEILRLITSHPAQYRAGVIGPDGYPDLITGQQAVHPVDANAWFEYLWEASRGQPDEVKAWVLGYMTHGAGDQFAHTMVNEFSGAPFTFEPPTNAVKHVVLEGYIDKRLPANALRGSFWNVSINGVEDFIYKTMVRAHPDSRLQRLLNRRDADGNISGRNSIPLIFSNTRNSLQKDITAYYDEKKRLQKIIDTCGTFDMSCSATVAGAQLAKLIAKDAAIVTYKEAWRDDIDRGLKKWPRIGHQTAMALAFNSDRKTDITKAKGVLGKYARDHLLSMSGAPDALGVSIRIAQNIIGAIVPDFISKKIAEMQKDLLNYILEESIGMNAEELRKYSQNPELHFDRVMDGGPGKNVTLATFNRDYLGLQDRGYTNPSEALDPMDVPAMYNTIQLTKLSLLDRSELTLLMKDLGSPNMPQTENILLGYRQNLDASNQWSSGNVLAKRAKDFCRIFMTQPGQALKCPTPPKPKPVAVVAEGGTRGKKSELQLCMERAEREPLIRRASAQTKCTAEDLMRTQKARQDKAKAEAEAAAAKKKMLEALTTPKSSTPIIAKVPVVKTPVLKAPVLKMPPKQPANPQTPVSGNRMDPVAKNPTIKRPIDIDPLVNTPIAKTPDVKTPVTLPGTVKTPAKDTPSSSRTLTPAESALVGASYTLQANGAPLADLTLRPDGTLDTVAANSAITIGVKAWALEGREFILSDASGKPVMRFRANARPENQRFMTTVPGAAERYRIQRTN